MSRSTPLLELLRLDEAHPDEFTAPASHERHSRSFGGQILAQSLVAATATVEPDRGVHSLSGYFLRPGKPDAPMVCKTERVRDGRSFSVRRVDVVQDERLTFSLLASFHREEAGPVHSDAMPDVLPPDALPPFEERFSGRDSDNDMGRWFARARPFDMRYAGGTAFDPPKPGHPKRSQVWMRVAEEIPDDSGISAAILAYASDMTLLDPILMTHGLRWTDRQIMGASLDHSMWFHGPFRADEWLLFDQWTPVAGGGRGLAHAQIWTATGRLIASVVQQALLRPPSEPPA